MPPSYEITQCLICQGQYKVMFPLDGTLNQCESLTVVQVLDSLQFLSIPQLKRLGAVLCFICVAKVQSCFKIKTQCYQLETENAFGSGSSKVSPALPLNYISPKTIYNKSFEENCIPNGNFNESYKFAKVKEEKNFEDVSTNMKSVDQETNVMDSWEVKPEIEIVENVIKIENDESFNGLIGVESNEQKSKGKPSLVCDVCQKSFLFVGNLVIHKRTHTGERPFECDICNKSFICSTNLTLHKRTHTGERPYECDVCNKLFSQLSNLKSHKRVHTGEKPYVCDVCNTSFSHSSILVRHKRVHTGEKPYACDVCNKTFTYSGDLLIHKRVHTGEKPYACDVCNESFICSRVLVRHKRIHTPKKSYPCDVCNKSFLHLRILLRHKRSHSGVKS